MGSSRPVYRTPASARIAAGIAAGVLGGILLIGCMMIYASVTDAGATMPLKALGALVYGVEALVAGPTAMLVGVLIQLAISIVIGILFALCMSRETSTVAALFSGSQQPDALRLFAELAVIPYCVSRGRDVRSILKDCPCSVPIHDDAVTRVETFFKNWEING